MQKESKTLTPVPVSYTHLDVYKRQIYDRPVITAAQSCRSREVVMAFDILPENLHFDAVDLEHGDSFFLCDSVGTLIYHKTDLQLPREELQEYLTGVVQRIQSGELVDRPTRCV